MAQSHLSLDALKNIVDRVLIESGKAVRQSAHSDAHGSPFILDRMQKELPVWNMNYHEALDRLEHEIIEAQRILRRDLAICQQERMEREQAAEAARQDKAREAAAPPPASAPATDNDMKRERESTPSKDSINLVNGGMPAEVKEEAVDLLPRKAVPSPKNTGLSLPTAKPTETPKQESTSQADADATKRNLEPVIATNPLSEPAPPTSAGFKDFDLDSMFPDSIGDGNDANLESNANNEFDFNAALSDEHNNDNALSNDLGQTSIDSILPGLESYANSLGDTGTTSVINITDLPMTGGPVTQAETSQEASATAGDSTFDDLFSYADFETGQNSGQGDGNSAMAATDFEDLFFNMDQS
ncbi:MAG: hypothetical protein M1822_001917 [Bathelium mastoideum]|nr:MAG: hypothetical protein M1822_001917 [Bathelium mastoideum]